MACGRMRREKRISAQNDKSVNAGPKLPDPRHPNLSLRPFPRRCRRCRPVVAPAISQSTDVFDFRDVHTALAVPPPPCSPPLRQSAPSAAAVVAPAISQSIDAFDVSPPRYSAVALHIPSWSLTSRIQLSPPTLLVLALSVGRPPVREAAPSVYCHVKSSVTLGSFVRLTVM